MRRGVRPALACVVALAIGVVPPAGGTGHSRCGSHTWCDESLSADARADLLLAAMTREEKFGLMGGDDPFGVFTGNPATGVSRGIPRLGVPDLFLNDGPAGLRARAAGTTGLPAPAALASTFDPGLAVAFGDLIGDEATKRGVDLVLAPMVNIVRYPGSGRAFETYGEDPHLAARIAVGFVEGLQRNRGPALRRVVADPKHFAANNHEINRFTVSAEVDDRTLREIYLPAFEAAVTEAGAGTVMLSYNRVNGTHMTENGPLVNGLLKDEWGFDGFTITDWGFAQRSTAGAANNGTELEMPYRWWYSPAMLGAAVDTGQVSMTTIDEHVRRILRTMFAFGVFDRPAYPVADPVDIPAHGALARLIEESGIVLLRNEGILPLDLYPGATIALIGPEADRYVHGGGSSAVDPFYSVTPLEGITTRAAAEGVEVVHDDGSDRARAAAAAAGAEVTIVFGSVETTEFVDRPCLALACTPAERDQDGLIRDVAAANPNTIVMLETSSAVRMPWAEDVAAILEAWYPGEEGGNAMARVLFGDVDPGGRLPVTFPAREEDTPFYLHPERWPGIAERAEYSEGVFVGYRWYDEEAIEPLFPFGHGLSYTTFSYSGLEVADDGTTVTVSATVTNTGTRPGSDVAQLYLSKPGVAAPQPPRWLAGFRKVSLAPGESATMTFTLDARSLSYWDTAAHAWVVDPGCYGIHVGRSSRALALHGAVARGGAACE